MVRRLRIAVSIFFAVAGVALCVLWVRSYFTRDYLRLRPSENRFFAISSREGIIGLSTWTKGIQGSEWELESTPVTGLPPKRKISNPVGIEIFRSEEFGGLSGVFPYWLAVLISVLTGIGTHWLPSRFSLCTLLIAITLVAVVLGLIVAAGI
jgi:hypothetical protein